MKIDGTVTTGLGKAAYFLSQDFYVNNFKKNCGFRPYPGTLNVIVPEEYLPQINKVKNECKNIIKPDEGFGAVKYIKARLNAILETIKTFFRKLLQIGNEIIKNATTSEIKDYYDVKEFDSNDIYDISKGTTKEDELFDYANIPDYYKSRKDSYEKEKDDFEIGM